MNSNALVRKLQIKPGQRLAVLNAPSGYVAVLGHLPVGAQLETQMAGDFDWIHLFAKNTDELRRFAPDAMAGLKDGGILWISYPKRASKVPTDISRDTGWDVVRQAGSRPVFQVSIDDVWSALRFRPLKPGK